MRKCLLGLVKFERDRFWREDFPKPFLEVPGGGE